MADEINRRLKQLKSKLTPQALTQIAYPYFKAYTPVLTGNAKSHTSIRNNEILADYPYAQRLDNGWSKQFGGVGMTEPTVKEVIKYINKTGNQ
jgi:hypothetical protein